MSGFVYFIGPDDWRLNRVKIGFTSASPRVRLSTFQTGSPFPLVVYGFVRADMAMEKILHATFRPLHVHGEWFRMEGKLLALVGEFYFIKYGRSAIGDLEFERAINATLFTDDPPHPTFSSIEEWVESADLDEIGGWSHDRAWAAYQAERVSA
jgi:hypothetical protein